MTSPPALSVAILAGAWLAGSLAWSAPGNTPAVSEQVDPLEAADPDDQMPRRLTPLLRRGQALRLLVDVLTGAGVAFLALRLAPVATPLPVTAHAYLAVFLAGLGHAWSPWRQRRGGMASPVILGGLLVLWPWCMPVLLLVGIGAGLATGYLIAAVALAMVALPILAWATDADLPRLLFCLAAAALVLARSAPALLRTWRGDESRFSRLRLLVRLRRP